MNRDKARTLVNRAMALLREGDAICVDESNVTIHRNNSVFSVLDTDHGEIIGDLDSKQAKKTATDLISQNW